jgi:hypothetical protein
MKYKTSQVRCLIFHTQEVLGEIVKNLRINSCLCLWHKRKQLYFKEQPAFYVKCLPISPVSSNMLICGFSNTGASSASALMLRLLAASCSLWALM